MSKPLHRRKGAKGPFLMHPGEGCYMRQPQELILFNDGQYTLTLAFGGKKVPLRKTRDGYKVIPISRLAKRGGVWQVDQPDELRAAGVKA